MHYTVISSYHKDVAHFVRDGGVTVEFSKADKYLESEAQGVARAIPGSVIFAVDDVRKRMISATTSAALERVPSGRAHSQSPNKERYIIAIIEKSPVAKWLALNGKFTRKLIRAARYTWEQAIAIQRLRMEEGLPAVSIYSAPRVEAVTRTEDCLEAPAARRMVAIGQSLNKNFDLSNYLIPNSYTSAEQFPDHLRQKLASEPKPSAERDKMWWSQHQCHPERAHILGCGNVIENRRLIQKILAYGGGEVHMPAQEDDLHALLERGQLIIPRRPMFKPGLPSQCHFNISRLWELNKDTVAIMTGYALSESAIWEQHSWGIHLNTGRIIETTDVRQAYFGIIVSKEKAERLAADHK